MPNHLHPLAEHLTTRWPGDVLQLSTSAALGGAFATGLLLFAPAELVAWLGMGAALAEWRPWVGAAFLVFVGVLVARSTASMGVWAKKR